MLCGLSFSYLKNTKKIKIQFVRKLNDIKQTVSYSPKKSGSNKKTIQYQSPLTKSRMLSDPQTVQITIYNKGRVLNDYFQMKKKILSLEL